MIGLSLLAEIIKQKGKVVQHAASKWVERYETNSDVALTELLTTLFQVSLRTCVDMCCFCNRGSGLVGGL